jgi:hypothetical protein
MELLKEVSPGVTRVGVLREPAPLRQSGSGDPGRSSVNQITVVENRCCPPTIIRTYPEVIGCDIVLLRVGMSVA